MVVGNSASSASSDGPLEMPELLVAIGAVGGVGYLVYQGVIYIYLKAKSLAFAVVAVLGIAGKGVVIIFLAAIVFSVVELGVRAAMNASRARTNMGRFHFPRPEALRSGRGRSVLERLALKACIEAEPQLRFAREMAPRDVAYLRERALVKALRGPAFEAEVVGHVQSTLQAGTNEKLKAFVERVSAEQVLRGGWLPMLMVGFMLRLISFGRGGFGLDGCRKSRFNAERVMSDTAACWRFISLAMLGAFSLLEEVCGGVDQVVSELDPSDPPGSALTGSSDPASLVEPEEASATSETRVGESDDESASLEEVNVSEKVAELRALLEEDSVAWETPQAFLEELDQAAEELGEDVEIATLRDELASYKQRLDDFPESLFDELQIGQVEDSKWPNFYLEGVAESASAHGYGGNSPVYRNCVRAWCSGRFEGSTVVGDPTTTSSPERRHLAAVPDESVADGDRAEVTLPQAQTQYPSRRRQEVI